jgi:ribosomal protein L7/L12
MQAIRLLRKQHGLGMVSAKRIVDAARGMTAVGR